MSQMVGQYVPSRRRDFFFCNNLPSCLDGLPVDSEREGCFRSIAQGMRQTHQVQGVGHVEEIGDQCKVVLYCITTRISWETGRVRGERGCSIIPPTHTLHYSLLKGTQD
jgi:hypothetical protein